jgi:hypothetical protein
MNISEILHRSNLLALLQTGVVQESFRLSFGAVGRLPRVAIQDALRYKNYVIPPGVSTLICDMEHRGELWANKEQLLKTPVSQSAYFVHTDPSIFPEPHTFKPERWARAYQDNVPLTRYLVSFTKGSRQCLGIP